MEPKKDKPPVETVQRGVRRFLQGVRSFFMSNKGTSGWDTLVAFLGTVVIAGFGLFVTHSYNVRANKVAEAELKVKEAEVKVAEVDVKVAEAGVVGQLIPYLSQDTGNLREAALLAISAMGDPDLAARFAILYGDDQSIAALKTMAVSSDIKAQKEGIAALKRMADSKDRSSNVTKEATKAIQSLPDNLKTLYKLKGY